MKETKTFQIIDDTSTLNTEEKFIYNIQHRIYKNSICKEFCGTLPNKKFVILKSVLGSGKTTSLLEIIVDGFMKNNSIIILSSRVAYANFICKLVNETLKHFISVNINASIKKYFVDYSKTKSTIRFNTDYPYLVISVESLWRIYREKFGICIFDEINSIIKEFGSIFNSKNLVTNRNIFDSLIKFSDRNIFLDGDINYISLDFIKKCAEEIRLTGKDIYFIENTYKSHTNLTYYYYHDQDYLLLVIKDLLTINKNSLLQFALLNKVKL